MVFAIKWITNVKIIAITTNIQFSSTTGETRIIATIRKSSWSRIGAGFPLPIPSLLFKKLPNASPKRAPKPSKNPIRIPLFTPVTIGVMIYGPISEMMPGAKYP